MTKKSQRKSKNRRGPTVRQVGGAIARQHPSVAEQAAKIGQGLVRTAINLGEHRAHAKLLAPIFDDMQRVIDGRSDGCILNNTDCRLMFTCLAEAGYMQDPRAAAKTMQ